MLEIPEYSALVFDQPLTQMYQGQVDFHCRVIYVRTYVNFTRVNIMEPKYERAQVNVKVERGSTFTFTRNVPDIASKLRKHEKVTRGSQVIICEGMIKYK